MRTAQRCIAQHICAHFNIVLFVVCVLSILSSGSNLCPLLTAKNYELVFQNDLGLRPLWYFATFLL